MLTTEAYPAGQALACPAVKKSSAYVRGLEMAINNILSAEEECQTALKEMTQAGSGDP